MHYASILSHSYKHCIYTIKQNKDFDINRPYILVDKNREVKKRENTKQIYRDTVQNKKFQNLP